MIRIRSLLYKISFWVFLMGFSTPVFAQFSMGAKGVGMGQATVAIPKYEWAIFTNPAMVDSNTTLGFYALRNYGFSELTDIAATGSLPILKGVAVTGFDRYGDELFNKTRIRIGYKNNWQNLHFGVVLNYNHIAFGADYGSGGALGFDVGVAAQVIPDLWIAAKAGNINHPEYRGINEELERDLGIGFSYKLHRRALFSADIVKDVSHPVSYRSGLEIEIINALKGRFGISTEPLTYSFGLGYSSLRWEVNIAIQQHSTLGTSPGLDLLFFF